MRGLVLGAALIGALQLLSIGTARAQDRDLRPLLDRLDRMERDMNQLQRQVYRGGSTSGAPVPVAPADGGTAVNLELRIDQIETQMRTLTGSLEEVNYSIDQLKRRLDKLVGDVDQRLTQLEHPGTPAGAAAGGVAAAPPGSPAPGAGANPAAPASQPGTLVAPPAAAQNLGGQTAAARPPGTPAPTPGGPGTLPTGSAQDQYNYAFGLLRQADYPAAEEALRTFVQRYPNDPLAGNAEYWLGETYFVRKDYNNAAATFAEGYRKYPQSGKAADNLLKLGMSLGNVGQKKEACLTFSQLAHDFPKASGNITERANQEKQRLGC
jgi:tol-pal system protein YbgF